jgi:hypothetical protein
MLEQRPYGRAVAPVSELVDLQPGRRPAAGARHDKVQDDVGRRRVLILPGQATTGGTATSAVAAADQ